MKVLRALLDRLHPHFDRGGRFEKLYPLYEAADTFLYTPPDITSGASHVRDSIDLKRMMTTVVVALAPCIFVAMWNTGRQANLTIHNHQVAHVLVDENVLDDAAANLLRAAATTTPLAELAVREEQASDADVSAALQARDPATVSLEDINFEENWRASLLRGLGGSYNPTSFWANLLHGALYFLPVYLVCNMVGGAWELLFSCVRKHEVNEGFFVTGFLFPLTLPPTIPLWQVAVGISFGVVIGKEVFGGTGKNFLNPALTARAFLYFGHADQMTGDKVWTAVDGFSGATPLTQLATADVTRGMETITSTTDGLGITWSQAFLGNVPGSMGETSALACLLGAALLIVTRIGSWRIMVSVLLGALGFSTLLWLVGSDSNPMFQMNPLWHLVVGGFAFGLVFMATDPVSAAMTKTGKWIYGALIGVMTILIRVINPAFPEGIMLAILFGNVFAPLIDYQVLQANKRRRAQRNAA